MSDIALTWDGTAADVSIVANDLATDEGLRTAILISLFTDRRAGETDELPDETGDRRGWWADALPDVPGDLTGSRLWLLARAKESPGVLSRAEEYTREALAWLLEDQVADRIDVAVEFLRPVRGLGIIITLYRPKRDPVRFRFGRTWAAEEARI